MPPIRATFANPPATDNVLRVTYRLARVPQSRWTYTRPVTIAAIGAPELLIALVLVLLLFGSTQLPKLARSLGQAKSELKKAAEEDAGEGNRPS